MRKIIILIFLLMVFTTTYAQHHFIRTDVLGYFIPYFNGSHAKEYTAFTPVKYSIGYEYLSDSSNQSLGIQLNYGSNPAYLIDFNGATETYNNITGFFIQPEYRYYFGQNKRKFRVFGSVGGLLHHGTLSSYTVLLPERKLISKDTKTINAVGLTFGGGFKYNFSKKLYTELLISFGYPLFRTPVLSGYEHMFFRFELGVGYHFIKGKTSKK